MPRVGRAFTFRAVEARVLSFCCTPPSAFGSWDEEGGASKMTVDRQRRLSRASPAKEVGVAVPERYTARQLLHHVEVRLVLDQAVERGDPGRELRALPST